MLGWPGRDGVRQVEDQRRPLTSGEDAIFREGISAIGSEHTPETLEERGLSRAIRPDDAEHLATTHRERNRVERRDPAEPLGQAVDTQKYVTVRWIGTGLWQRPSRNLSAGGVYYQRS